MLLFSDRDGVRESDTITRTFTVDDIGEMDGLFTTDCETETDYNSFFESDWDTDATLTPIRHKPKKKEKKDKEKDDEKKDKEKKEKKGKKDKDKNDNDKKDKDKKDKDKNKVKSFFKFRNTVLIENTSSFHSNVHSTVT